MDITKSAIDMSYIGLVDDICRAKDHSVAFLRLKEEIKRYHGIHYVKIIDGKGKYTIMLKNKTKTLIFTAIRDRNGEFIVKLVTIRNNPQ